MEGQRSPETAEALSMAGNGTVSPRNHLGGGWEPGGRRQETVVSSQIGLGLPAGFCFVEYSGGEAVSAQKWVWERVLLGTRYASKLVTPTHPSRTAGHHPPFPWIPQSNMQAHRRLQK